MDKELGIQQIYFVRSPVFNAKLEVVACELFFCQSADGEFKKEASVEDIIDSFTVSSFEDVIGNDRIFLPYPVGGIEDGDLPVDKGQIILELGAETHSLSDTDILSIVKRLARNGFSTALNLAQLAGDLPEIAQLAEIIKLRVDNIGKDELARKVALLKNSPAKLCAVNINSYSEFEQCKKLGFDYFQGQFLSKPWHVEIDAIPASRMVVLQLLCGLLSPEVTPDQIVDLLSKDARLSYKLLAIMNSAAFSLPRTIESLVEAVVLLGLNKLRSWASLIALSTVDDKPRELMLTAMIRAKMCELLAEAVEQKNSDSYFTVGLFSVLDAMLDRSFADILKLIPLADSLKKALTDYEGMLGMILFNVIAYEQARWRDIKFPGLTVDDYREAYLCSVVWAKEILHTLDKN